MKADIVFTAIAFLAAFLVITGPVFAIDASEFALTATAGYYDEPIFVHYENPSWTPPTVNLTLDTGGLTLVSGDNPALGVTGNVYTWELSAAAPGTYNLNLTADDGNGSASNQLTLNLIARTDPQLAVSMTDTDNVTIGQSFNIAADLNNTGSGTAYGIGVYLDLLDANYTSPLSLPDIAGGGTDSVTFSVTPTKCAVYLATVRADYKNDAGEQMPSSFTNDIFEVIGPDLAVTKVNASEENPTEGAEITLYAFIKNIGQTDSTGFTVTFYKGDPANNDVIGTASSSNSLAPGEETSVSVDWTVSGCGALDIYAIVSSTECNPNNNQGSGSVNGTAVCGDGYCNGGETCSSCPQDCGECPPSPPGGGGWTGGGGGGPPATCIVDWNCSEWSSCSPQGVQTRVCQEIRGPCQPGIEEPEKPEEITECTYVIPEENVTFPEETVPEVLPEEKPVPGVFDSITGFITANAAPITGVVVVFIVVLVGAFIWRRRV